MNENFYENPVESAAAENAAASPVDAAVETAAGDPIFAASPQPAPGSGEKPKHTASLVLGILSIVFALLFALVGDILAIIGIVLACVKRKDYNTKAGLICSIIGLVLSIVSHIVGAIFVKRFLGM